MAFLFDDPGSTSLTRLIRAAQDDERDDSLAMDRIIRRFEPLTQRLARSMSSCPFLRDDLANAARFALVRAVRRHDPCRVGFPSYAERFMRGACLRELQRWSNPDARETLTAMPVGDQPSAERLEESAIDRLTPWGDGSVASAIESISSPQAEIVALRYERGLPLETIAATLGTSKSAVSQRLSTIHRSVERSLALAA